MTIEWTELESVEEARAVVGAGIGPGTSRDEIAVFLGANGIDRAYEDDGVVRARVRGRHRDELVVVWWLLEFHLDAAGSCERVDVDEQSTGP